MTQCCASRWPTPAQVFRRSSFVEATASGFRTFARAWLLFTAPGRSSRCATMLRTASSQRSKFHCKSIPLRQPTLVHRHPRLPSIRVRLARWLDHDAFSRHHCRARKRCSRTCRRVRPSRAILRGGYTRFRGPDLASSGLYILGGGGIRALDSDRSLALSKVRHKSGTGRNRGVLSDEPVGMVELVYGSFISVCSADVDPYGCGQFARSPHSAHGSVDHRAFRGNGGGRL